ncbi:YbaK/EbsC family protein [Kineococcus glutinatus]|uniref:YbaK/aminoacyl-tRNA synthetase-associated domain-containing protein n=1 Tax=Kineococcus glutinatus TaxID=1070872 RepID=A0ABP8VFD9_9ACTN
MDAEATGTARASRLLEQPAVAALADALQQLCAAGSVRVLPADVRTPEEVARHLGVEPAALAGCVLLVPPRPPDAVARRARRHRHHVRHRGRHHGEAPDGVLVVTSRAHRVVPEQIADVLGVPALEVAGAVPVLAGTGAVTTGVAPLGHPEPLTTLVDVALVTQPVVWATAGHPGVVFPTRYEELLRLTGGQPVEVG